MLHFWRQGKAPILLILLTFFQSFGFYTTLHASTSPLQSQAQIIEVIKGTGNRAKGQGWLGACIAVGCLAVADLAYVKNQQMHSKIPCLQHTQHVLGAPCNGKSKQCPFGNFLYAYQIVPTVNDIRTWTRGFGIERAPTTDDYLFGDLKDQYFPAHPFKVPLKTLDPTTIQNSLGEEPSSSPEDGWENEKETIVEKLKNFRFEEADRRLMYGGDLSEKNLLLSTQVTYSMNQILLAAEKEYANYANFFSEDQKKILERFKRELFYRINLCGYLLVDLANYKSYEYALEDLYFLSRRFAFFLSSIPKVPDVLTNIADQIQETWSSFDSKFKVVFPIGNDGVRLRLQETARRWSQRYYFKNFKKINYFRIGSFELSSDIDVTTMEYIISSALFDGTIPRDAHSLQIAVGPDGPHVIVIVRAISDKLKSRSIQIPKYKNDLEMNKKEGDLIGWTDATYEVNPTEDNQSEIVLRFKVAKKRFGSGMPYEK